MGIREQDALLYGRDLVLPSPGEAVLQTTSGDWPVLEGRPNLRAAIQRRALTSPRSMLHRPDYGAGVALLLETPATPTTLAAAATAIRVNGLRDHRIRDLIAIVGAADAQVEIELAITPLGETDAEGVTFLAE